MERDKLVAPLITWADRLLAFVILVASGRLLFPNFPRRLPLRPKAFQEHPVAQGIHRLPETGVAKRHQLAIVSESLEGFFLPDGVIAGDVIHHRGFEHEEAPVDPGALAI